MRGSIRKTAVLLTVLIVAVSIPLTAASEAQPKIGIASASLSLKDNVYIHFDVVGEGFDTEYGDYGLILWTSPQDDLSYTVENADSSNAVIYGRSSWSYDSVLGRDACRYIYAVSAKELADVVYARAYVTVGTKTYYSSVVPYSVHTYAARKLGYVSGVSATSDESLKELLVGMLNYGALAQKHFDHQIGTLANEFLTDGHSHSVSKWSTVSESDTTVKKLGACTSCGLVQSVTETKASEPVVAELTYDVRGEGCYITGFSGDHSGKEIKIEIPDILGGKEVVGIAEEAFMGYTNIISVKLPSGLKIIEGNAFNGCSSICEIILPSGLNEISPGAFKDCSSLESVTFLSIDNWKVLNLDTFEYDDIDLSEPFDNAVYLRSEEYVYSTWVKLE